MKRIFIALAVLFARICPAVQIVEPFSDPTHFQTLPAPLLSPVFNLITHQFQVPYAISENPAPLTEDFPFPIGNGTDGAFGQASYALFDVGGKLGENILTLSTGRIYQFTTFELASNLTLVTSGTGPLEIHVQGNASLDAGSTIALSGANGATSGAAGQGGPGGNAGGAGGTVPSQNGTDGQPADATLTGEGGGGQLSATTDTAGGGGGGGHLNAGIPGNTGSAPVPANPGNGGQAYDDVFPTNAWGGSGGGGGGANLDTAGGGGGGGGGVLKLFVGGNFTVNATAQIHADGGNGGDGGGTAGAGGGGGAGGTLLIFAAGTVDNEAEVTLTGGGLTAVAGNGGAGPNGGAGAGGGGSDGMVWDLAGEGIWGIHDPSPALELSGTIFFSMKSFRLQSNYYDTGYTSPTYGTVNVQDSSAQGDLIQYSFAGASDPAHVPTDADFVDKSEITKLNGLRYLMLRVQLQGISATRSPTVSNVTLTAGQPAFTFQTQGCARVNPGGLDGINALVRTLLLLFPMLIPWVFRRSRRVRR